VSDHVLSRAFSAAQQKKEGRGRCCAAG
jgi:hypothetical protein